MVRGLLGIGGALFLAACGPTGSNTPVTYQTYRYSCCLELTGNDTWRAGQHVTLHWRAQPAGQTSDAQPQLINLDLSITGPFTTVDSLKQAIGSNTTPKGTRTIKLASGSLFDRPAMIPETDVTLPADLAPGYYNLNETMSENGYSAGGGAIIVIK